MADLRTYPLRVGQLTTRIIETGNIDASAVVFLHGMGARADRWTKNLGAIAEQGFRALALDLPGHGFATKGTLPDYSVAGYADFVLGALRALELRGASLVGTSLGANVAAAVACRTGSNIRRLLLVGALGLVPVGRERCKAMAASLGRQTPESIRQKLEVVVGDHSIITDSWIDEESRVNMSPGAEEGFARLAEYVSSRLDGDVVGPALAKLEPSVPVLLVWGEIDQPVPLELGREAAKRFGWPLHVIKDAGHVVYRERTEQFNAALVGFLSGS